MELDGEREMTRIQHVLGSAATVECWYLIPTVGQAVGPFATLRQALRARATYDDVRSSLLALREECRGSERP